MKNYNTKIAAEKLVTKRVSLGTSRHQHKHQTIDVITSVGTARNHESALKLAADWLLENKGKHLKNLNESDAVEYLNFRAMTVGQSAVDLARQAINFHLLCEEPIKFVASTIQQKLTNRAYNQTEIDLLVTEANAKLALSIKLAQNAGLRAAELITIAPPTKLQESPRDGWKPNRFVGRENEISFVVHGKGGLCREVRLPTHLATQLIARSRPEPITIVDREVRHQSHFDLLAGVNFSVQFSNLSEKVLWFSHGAHGLRHSFAKKRLHDLICLGLTHDDAMDVLSNELGHFCTANTLAYLRD